MTKHDHRSLRRNNEFDRLEKGEEQKYTINQKQIKEHVAREEKAEDSEYEEKRRK